MTRSQSTGAIAAPLAVAAWLPLTVLGYGGSLHALALVAVWAVLVGRWASGVGERRVPVTRAHTRGARA